MYGGTLDDFGESARQTMDGGYIIAGYTQDPGPVLMNIIKTDDRGYVQWQRFFGRTAEYARCVRPTFDGGYIVAGSTVAWGPGNHTACLIKLDPFGNTQWFRTYGGPTWEQANSVRQTKDFGYVFTGICETYGGGGHNVWIVKTNIIGDTLWTKEMAGDFYDWGECIQALSDDSYIVAARYGQGPGSGDYWLIRLESGYDESTISVDDAAFAGLSDYSLLSVYPNPFNQQTTISFRLQAASNIELKVFDITGREVWSLADGSWQLAVGKHQYVWDAEGMASGVYFVRLDVLSGAGTRQYSKVRKMVLLK